MAKIPPFLHYGEEFYFKDPRDAGKLHKCPSIFDQASKSLSVIIPAKDEEKRLPVMLDECVEFLEEKTKKDKNFDYEIILVDDASKDKTTELALEYSSKLGVEKFRVLTLKKNRGKGGAVRFGFWMARGRNLLFADADGATKFDDFDKLEAEMKDLVSFTPSNPNEHASTEENSGSHNNEDSVEAVVVGSRAHLEKESIAQRSILRTILMFGFHFLVWFFCVKTVRDTQCGFKLFTRPAVRILFWNLHIERWAFDVELLFMAEKLGIPIKEVAVTWHEVEGSKLTPLAASIEMARDLFMIWFRYFIGLWSIDRNFSDFSSKKEN